jgi:hypothetical protein
MRPDGSRHREQPRREPSRLDRKFVERAARSKMGPIAAMAMVLEEDGEGSRTPPLHPDVPEQPNGLALDVEKGDALGSMFTVKWGSRSRTQKHAPWRPAS